MKIRKIYKSIVLSLVLLMLVLPSIAMAEFLETRPADLIKKDQATLRGYYFDSSGGYGGYNQNIFLSFSYSKTEPKDNKCATLHYQTDTKKTALVPASPTRTNYSKLINLLDPETKYYFCFIAYVENAGGFGGSKTYTPTEYGKVLNFQTLKGFNINNNTSGTKTGGVSPRKTPPNEIGDVETYLASRTTDTEALFSGYVNRLSGEAYAYFRYATLDKPPVFCNDIYGSAQRSAVADRPNPYGKISNNDGEAYIRAEIEKAKQNKQKVINDQNKLVEQARLNLMNSQPFLVEKVKGDPKAVAPIIDGYYNRPNDGGGVIYITVGSRIGGNKFPDFTYSGLVSGKGNVQNPEVLGNTGLELNFYTFPYIENSEWKLTIPNKNSPEYNTNNNAYNQSILNRTQAIADADAQIAKLEAELQKILQGISGGSGFSTVVKGLTENTIYYYCAIVSNSSVNPTEIEYGPVQSFRTLPCQSCPKTHITSVGVSNVSSNTANLQGSYASIPEVDTFFEYKKESDTEWKKTSRDNHGANTYGRFNQTIASLSPSSLYQFRAVGEVTTTVKTSGGASTSKIFFGDTLSFRTGSGNLFDKYGWTEEPEKPDPGDNDTTIDPEYPYTGGIDGNCSDGIQNGDETGIDTGGRCGKKTIDPENPFPNNGNCNDGIQNGDETGIDFGGRCLIPPLPTCFDGIQNNNETGIDTGGWCGDGTNGNCTDGIKNGDETGIDTGGRCSNGNGGPIIVVGPGGTVKNNGGTTISSGGTTTISGGTITTSGGTTTISGGTTNINGQNTSINNGIATNTGGTASTTGGTTTLRGGTTTITYKDANGNTQTFITNSEVKITRNGNTNVVTFKDVNGNTQTIVIKDGEGQITNVGGVRTTENGNTVLTGGRTNVLDNRSGPKLGDRLTPPSDAIVRYHEGIETVFTRQIMRNLSFAKLYGYDDSMNLQNFADTLSHTFAKEYFGYIDASGLEVRVSKPDVSAYELRQVGGVLTVYEYYENVIVDIRNTTTIFKNKNPYEYYDRRRR